MGQGEVISVRSCNMPLVRTGTRRGAGAAEPIHSGRTKSKWNKVAVLLGTRDREGPDGEGQFAATLVVVLL